MRRCAIMRIGDEMAHWMSCACAVCGLGRGFGPSGFACRDEWEWWKWTLTRVVGCREDDVREAASDG